MNEESLAIGACLSSVLEVSRARTGEIHGGQLESGNAKSHILDSSSIVALSTNGWFNIKATVPSPTVAKWARASTANGPETAMSRTVKFKN
jgi:hypothetical protein